MGAWTEQVFHGLKKFMDKLCGEYWTLLCFVPRPCEFTFLRRVVMWDIQLELLKWTRLQQTKGKVYKVANLPSEDTDRMVVIMYSNDGDFHLNIIPLFEYIQAAGSSSAERVTDISALVRRERKPKMLTDVMEKNFLPSKWKMTGMDPPEKVVCDGMEREPNAMMETLKHFCPADEAVVFLGKGHAGLVWELLRSHRHCIVLEGEGMKFEFLTQFIDKMVKTRDYYANFTKPPPRHDEGRDLVYKVGQNVVNIWEFLFETKPQDRGERTYILRRRKMEKLLRGYHKAPSEREVSFLDRLETMYFDQLIGAFTIAGYATCFVDGEDFDADDSEEKSVDDTLQAALAAERQKAYCPASHSQRMGVPGTSSGCGGASSMAVSTDQLMTQPPNSSIVTLTQMAGNTMTVASGGSLDPNVLAMLSPELVATLAPFAHSPSTIMEFLRSRTPQQPPPDEPLEYEIEDTIPADIRLLPGPIVCRDDYTRTDDATWGHHIIWHPQHFQPALARGRWVMAIKEEGGWQFCLHRRMSGSNFLKYEKNQIAKRLLRLNPEVSQSRLDWLEYLEELYDRQTSGAFGYYWHVREDLGERKNSSGGGDHGKGSGSSGGVHGKGLRSGSGASDKGPEPNDGASGKDASRGERQQTEKSKGRQATEGKGSTPSGGGHGKPTGPSGGGSTVEGSQGPQETERKGSGSSGGSTVEGSHGRVEHDSGLALERSRLDQAKIFTIESNPTVGSETIAGTSGKASGPRGGSTTIGGGSPVKESHDRVEHNTRPAFERSRLDQAKKLTVSRTRQWDRDQSQVQVARLRDQSTLFHLLKGYMAESNTTGVHYWSAPSLTERRNSWLSPTRQSNGD
ncbi:hypothetical protein CBR_g26282 [Chara braunii]|uniref:Uncharacterized protein n=1 Tax=Chara braunii TaxID=69332 RepID=A0A388L7G4_CHABU|nr:hypothetical protein CBR_g26282 [Chara braunii]|eukprot:GBG78249.1 hypothetical protein CBR_g26282 [Chara braunii]